MGPHWGSGPCARPTEWDLGVAPLDQWARAVEWGSPPRRIACFVTLHGGGIGH